MDDVSTEQRRRIAVDLFNSVWTLLEIRERTPEQDDEMIHAAHASRHHWAEVGTTANLARGEWQCSRVYATVGRAEPALHHARRCLAYCEQGGEGVEEWDLPFAYESLARAHAVAGDWSEADRWRSRAIEAGRLIGDVDDRELLLSDVATIPRRP